MRAHSLMLGHIKRKMSESFGVNSGYSYTGALGLTFDTSDCLTICIAYNTRGSDLWDMPCLLDNASPQSVFEGSDDILALVDALPEAKREQIEDTIQLVESSRNKAPILRRTTHHTISKNPIQSSKKGMASWDYLVKINHYITHMFGPKNGSLRPMRSLNEWWPAAQNPMIRQEYQSVMTDQDNSVPNILKLQSDQASDILQLSQALTWIGFRVFHTPDFNHRDDNDHKLVPDKIVHVIVNILTRLRSGPFHTRSWRRSILAAADLLAETEGKSRWYCGKMWNKIQVDIMWSKILKRDECKTDYHPLHLSEMDPDSDDAHNIFLERLKMIHNLSSEKQSNRWFATYDNAIKLLPIWHSLLAALLYRRSCLDG